MVLLEHRAAHAHKQRAGLVETVLAEHCLDEIAVDLDCQPAAGVKRKRERLPQVALCQLTVVPFQGALGKPTKVLDLHVDVPRSS